MFVWDWFAKALGYLHTSGPLEDITLFKNNFEKKYGPLHPTFYSGTYNQALSEAKKDLKFLLVYLHCDQHQDTDDFCSNVLTHREVINYVSRNELLFWACSVDKQEGYQVSQALRENTYPFLALITLRNERMVVVKAFEGNISVEKLLSQLQKAIEDNESSLVVARQDRQERNMRQLLREEQDMAYAESLKADKEKDKRKEEEKRLRETQELARRKKEMDETKRRERLMKMKIDLLSKIPQEPSNDVGVIRLSIKLPNGTRLDRKFLKTDPVKYLYYFVFCHQESPLLFQITTNFPRRELPGKPEFLEIDYDPSSPNSSENDMKANETLEDIGLQKSELLFVRDLEA